MPIECRITVSDDSRKAVLTGSETTDFARFSLRVDVEAEPGMVISRDAHRIIAKHLTEIGEYLRTSEPEPEGASG